MNRVVKKCKIKPNSTGKDICPGIPAQRGGARGLFDAKRVQNQDLNFTRTRLTQKRISKQTCRSMCREKTQRQPTTQHQNPKQTRATTASPGTKRRVGMGWKNCCDEARWPGSTWSSLLTFRSLPPVTWAVGVRQGNYSALGVGRSVNYPGLGYFGKGTGGLPKERKGALAFRCWHLFFAFSRQIKERLLGQVEPIVGSAFVSCLASLPSYSSCAD